MRKLILREEQDLVQGPEQGQQSLLRQPVLPSWTALGQSWRRAAEARGAKLRSSQWGELEGKRQRFPTELSEQASFPVELSEDEMLHSGGREPLRTSV